jgi:hypothetical protein
MNIKTKRSRFALPPVQRRHGWMILSSGDFWTYEVFSDAKAAFDCLDNHFSNMPLGYVEKFRVVRGYTTMHLTGLEEAEVEEAIR